MGEPNAGLGGRSTSFVSFRDPLCLLEVFLLVDGPNSSSRGTGIGMIVAKVGRGGGDSAREGSGSLDADRRGLGFEEDAFRRSTPGLGGSEGDSSSSCIPGIVGGRESLFSCGVALGSGLGIGRVALGIAVVEWGDSARS